MLSRCIAFVCFLRVVAAVFADEAYNIDYHYALLGEPQESTTFFHRPSLDSRASLIYTLSEQHGLGAINPKDGSLVWRHLLSPRLQRVTPSNNTFLRAIDGHDLIVSGVNKVVSTWSASDGKLVWDYQTAGELADVEILEFGQEKGTIILSKDREPQVTRLDIATGKVKWTHQLDGNDIPYQLSTSPTKIYVVLLHKTLLGYYKLRVVSIDLVTGDKLDEYTLSSENELASAETILMVGANSASPIIGWSDAAYSVFKVNVLGSKSITSFPIKHAEGKAVSKISLHAPFHAASEKHFLAHYSTDHGDWADVYHVDAKTENIEKAYSLPTLAGRSTFSISTIDANVYFTRISQSEVMTVSSASHGVLGRWPTTSLGTFGSAGEQSPQFAISELSVKGDSVSAIRSAVWLSTGELVLLRDGGVVWSRPEALADTLSAEFEVLASTETIEKVRDIVPPSNPIQAYMQRLSRHMAQLPSALSQLQSWVSTLVLRDSSGQSNAFGFDQVVICTTSKGLTLGLQVGSSGKISSIASKGHAIKISTNELLHAGSTVRNNTNAYSYQWKGAEIFGYADAAHQVPTWSFTPTIKERIIEIYPRPAADPVASIGIVMGNRKVLYKYLNPNLAMVISADEASRKATFTMLDTVSGAILYSNTHENVDQSLPVIGIISESWFAYSFTAENSSSSPKGHQLVAGELFESVSADDRGPLDTAQTYSSFATTSAPFVSALTFHIPEPISAMSVTRTAQGITSRQLLAVLPESDSIVGIPRAVIDPRRPLRDPTKDEQMEGLFKYNPVLEFDPKWYLNHRREVTGIQKIIASPAVLESTSLIFAYGFDVFGTRLSPSFNFDMLGKDFNKFQMLATVLALAIATFVIGPSVVRKQVNARWSLHA